MADVVQARMEAMVEEVKDLEEKGILSKEEVRALIRKRRDFEYRTVARSATMGDFLDYIEYEVAFESLRNHRNAKLGWTTRSVSDNASMARLHRLFKKALARFPSDRGLWYQYADFCMRTGATSKLLMVLMKALAYHPHDESLWLLAADRELRNGHLEAPRRLFQLALRGGSGSLKLWMQYLRFEAAMAERLAKKRRLKEKMTKNLEERRGEEDDKEAEEKEEKEEGDEDDEEGDESGKENADGGVPRKVGLHHIRVLVKVALKKLEPEPALRSAFLFEALQVVAGLQQSAVSSDFEGIEPLASLLEDELEECDGLLRVLKWKLAFLSVDPKRGGDEVVPNEEDALFIGYPKIVADDLMEAVSQAKSSDSKTRSRGMLHLMYFFNFVRIVSQDDKWEDLGNTLGEENRFPLPIDEETEEPSDEDRFGDGKPSYQIDESGDVGTEAKKDIGTASTDGSRSDDAQDEEKYVGPEGKKVVTICGWFKNQGSFKDFMSRVKEEVRRSVELFRVSSCVIDHQLSQHQPTLERVAFMNFTERAEDVDDGINALSSAARLIREREIVYRRLCGFLKRRHDRYLWNGVVFHHLKQFASRVHMVPYMLEAFYGLTEAAASLNKWDAKDFRSTASWESLEELTHDGDTCVDNVPVELMQFDFRTLSRPQDVLPEQAIRYFKHDNRPATLDVHECTRLIASVKMLPRNCPFVPRLFDLALVGMEHSIESFAAAYLDELRRDLTKEKVGSSSWCQVDHCKRRKPNEPRMFEYEVGRIAEDSYNIRLNARNRFAVRMVAIASLLGDLIRKLDKSIECDKAFHEVPELASKCVEWFERALTLCREMDARKESDENVRAWQKATWWRYLDFAFCVEELKRDALTLQLPSHQTPKGVPSSSEVYSRSRIEVPQHVESLESQLSAKRQRDTPFRGFWDKSLGTTVALEWFKHQPR